MKKIYLFLFPVCCLFFTACGNAWLDDLEPNTYVESSKSIKNDIDAEYALHGIMVHLRNYEYYGARMTFYADAKGDDMQANGNSKRVAKYYLFTFSREDSPSGFWNYPYKVIRNVNNVVEYVEGIPEAERSDKLKDIYGQVLTFRAMAHFDLVRIYGYPYTKDNGASLGVPVVGEKIDYTEKPSRNTVAQVYDQILKDLNAGSAFIGKKPTNVGINWFGNQLLLARAYLYMGNDDKAYEVATNLITEANANKYRLWTNDEYPNVWAKDSDDLEMFFRLIVKSGEVNDSKEFIGYLYAEKPGYDDSVLTSDFIDLLNEDPDDIRHNIVRKGSKNNYLMKYPANASDAGDHTFADIPVLRLSEAYLIAAEAAVKKNDKKNAAFYLNAIVNRANPDMRVAEDDVTLDRVLIERRKEFVGEGHRFFDAMRNGKKIERTGKSHTSVLLTAEAKSFDWNWSKIVMAIPRAEIDANSNIVQNPGY